MSRPLRWSFGAAALAAAAACAPHIKPSSMLPRRDRLSVIRRARVWAPVDVAHANIRRGPSDPHGFAPGQTVTCRYSDKKFDGASPKFACVITPDDVVKVKYGRDNGEVFAEVAATRLLWALGFGADHMYPVRVVCDGCSLDPFEEPGRGPGRVVFDPAAIERKLPGKEIETPGLTGWSWDEIDAVSEQAGGATRAERDALKLLAVMLQHTDSKPQQQRLLCLDAHAGRNRANACAHPFMMLNDVGVTFGRANLANDRVEGSVNLEGWARQRVFTTDTGPCIGNIARSFTGTLDHPAISEAGRTFLSNLLMRMTDRQLHDLFDVARFPMRMTPTRLSSGSVDQWVAAFKAKRREIATRSCS